jgi:hypothetical protein
VKTSTPIYLCVSVKKSIWEALGGSLSIASQAHKRALSDQCIASALNIWVRCSQFYSPRGKPVHKAET